MTENLLQKLEEKMMLLLTELEDSRNEIQRLNNEMQRVTQENSMYKAKQEQYSGKITDLISLLDTINTTDNMITNIAASAMKPVLVKGMD